MKTEVKNWLVTTKGKERVSIGPTITKFKWLEDAVKFAVKYNGELNANFSNP